MNAIASSILVLLMLLVLLAPRRWALLGMIAGVLYLTQGVSISLFGVNMFAIRFLEIAGFARVVTRREFSFSNLNKMDYAFLFLYSYATIVFFLREKNPAASNIAMALDPVLCYFTFRGLVAELNDLRWFLRSLVILIIPFVALVAMEMVMFKNQFGFVGQTTEQLIRDGRPRCIGSFRQPITMGSFGVSFLPLYIGLALDKTKRKHALVGICLCMSIVLLSNSGGPLSAAIFGLVGWLCWFMRKKMFLVRLTIVAMVIFIASVMQAPIWYLPAKISSLSGGGGWHRSYLIEMAIRDIDKWWFAGLSIIETKDWMPYTLEATGGSDITNQFLSFGLYGGLGAVVLFIWLLIKSFKNIGQALNEVRLRFQKTSEDEYLVWGLGSMLVAHVGNMFGVCYFDQMYMVWFMQLAAISSISQSYVAAAG